MTCYIDTSVIMYAGGAAHPHRDSCRAVMAAIASDSLDAVTSTQVVQEILHRFSRGQRQTGERMAMSVVNLFDDLLPIDRRVIADTVSRYRANPRLSARDAIHVAACSLAGIGQIVSLDTDFDDEPEIQRVDPAHALDSA